MKNKKILLVIIIFLVLVLIAFAGVYAYITLDVFRTPKQLFGKYLDNQIEQIENMNSGALKKVSENLKTVPSQTKYSMNMKGDSGDGETSFSYKQTTILDPENSAGMLKLNATLESMEGEITTEETPELPLELMDYTFYGDKDKVVVKIPELNEKYFSIKTDTILEKVQDVLKENEVSNIELSKESIEKYKNEFKTLYNKYLEEVKTKLTDDKFSADKNIEIDVNGTKLSANKYTFSISSTELKTTVVDILNKIAEEPILSDFMTEEQISNFKDAIPTLTDDVEVLEEDAILKLCVYENSGNTVKVELQVNDEVFAELMTSKISDSETNLVINVINKKSEDGEVGCIQTITYSVNSENENTTTATVTSSITYDEEDIESLKEYYEENNYYYYTDEMIEENYKNKTTSETIKTTVNGNTATSQISVKGDTDEDKLQVSDIKIEYNFGITPEFDNFEDVIELEDYLEDEEKTSLLVMECIQNLQNNPNTALGGIYGIVTSFTNLSSNFSIGTTDDEENSSEFDSNSEFNLEDTQFTSLYKSSVEQLITDALNDCLESYQRDLEDDPNVNVADYLTINKISEMILSSSISDLEMIDGSTLKCKYYDEVYYIKLVLNGETLKVDEATAYTESEYEEL